LDSSHDLVKASPGIFQKNQKIDEVIEWGSSSQSKPGQLYWLGKSPQIKCESIGTIYAWKCGAGPGHFGYFHKRTQRYLACFGDLRRTVQVGKSDPQRTTMDVPRYVCMGAGKTHRNPQLKTCVGPQYVGARSCQYTFFRISRTNPASCV
jgi:hypothetical protein